MDPMKIPVTASNIRGINTHNSLRKLHFPRLSHHISFRPLVFTLSIYDFPVNRAEGISEWQVHYMHTKGPITRVYLPSFQLDWNHVCVRINIENDSTTIYNQLLKIRLNMVEVTKINIVLCRKPVLDLTGGRPM